MLAHFPQHLDEVFTIAAMNSVLAMFMAVFARLLLVTKLMPMVPKMVPVMLVPMLPRVVSEVNALLSRPILPGHFRRRRRSAVSTTQPDIHALFSTPAFAFAIALVWVISITAPSIRPARTRERALPLSVQVILS